MFIAAKNWKLPKCPSMGIWLNSLLYTHGMRYYSAVKRSKVLITHKLDEPQGNYVSDKKPVSIIILPDSMYMAFLN